MLVVVTVIVMGMAMVMHGDSHCEGDDMVMHGFSGGDCDDMVVQR